MSSYTAGTHISAAALKRMGWTEAMFKRLPRPTVVKIRFRPGEPYRRPARLWLRTDVAAYIDSVDGQAAMTRVIQCKAARLGAKDEKAKATGRKRGRPRKVDPGAEG